MYCERARFLLVFKRARWACPIFYVRVKVLLSSLNYSPASWATNFRRRIPICDKQFNKTRDKPFHHFDAYLKFKKKSQRELRNGIDFNSPLKTIYNPLEEGIYPYAFEAFNDVQNYILADKTDTTDANNGTNIRKMGRGE